LVTFCPILLTDSERLLKERFGFGVLAHILVKLGQVIEANKRIGIFRAQDLLVDPERFLKERFGFDILPRILVQDAQVIEDFYCAGMFSTLNLLVDSERFLVERFSLGVFAYIRVQDREVIDRLRRIWIFWIPRALCQFYRSFRNGNRLLVFSLS
jgi:hypothetical protein